MSSASAHPTAEHEALAALLDDARLAEAALEHDQALTGYAVVATRAGADALGREALRRRADLLLKLGKSEAAAAAFDALVAALEASPDEVQAELALALAERAHAAYRSGDGPGIARFAERAEALARRVARPDVIAHALRYLGIAREFAGRHAEAEALYLELLDLAPDTRHLGPVCNSLGEIARATGRFELAASWYRRSHEEWRRTRGDEPDIVYLNNLGAALVELGQAAEGRALLDRAIAEQRRTGWLAMLSETYHYRGLSWLLAGDTAAATRDVVEGFLLAAEHGESEMQGILLRLLARIRAAGGERVAAPGDLPDDASPLALVERSVELLSAAGKPAEVARSRWFMGVLLASEGRVEEARAELGAARETFERLGVTPFAEAVAVSIDHLPTPLP